MATVNGDIMNGFSIETPMGDPLPAEPVRTPSVESVGPASTCLPTASATANHDDEAKPLHRIREVRLQQGVSLRSAARHTGRDVRTLRQQEAPDADLSLTDLMRWQQALDVPLIDLLEEGNAPLSRPVMERARLLRIMKTATAIQERCESEGIRRMATMLMEQLIEVMPELRDVSAWHNYGQRRSLDEMGRIFDHQVSTDDQMNM